MKNSVKKGAATVLLFICLAFGFLPSVALAQAQPDTNTSAIPENFNVNDYLQIKDKDKNPQQNTYVPAGNTPAGASTGIIGFLTRVIDLFIRLIATVSFLVFIGGAIYMLVSQGKSDQLEKGKSAMLYAILGLIISLMAFVIVTFVQSVLF